MARTNWQYDDIVTEQDMNQIGVEINSNKIELDEHLAEYAIQTATGTANEIIITTGGDFQYMQGNKIQFQAIASSTDVVTVNIDNKGAKPLKKIDGGNATLKINKVYEIFYSVSDDCFFLLASAEGNAVAENVLAGLTFSNDDDNGILGTMSNRGAVTNTITTQNGKFTIPEGFHDGAGQITATFANLTSKNIREGINIGGVVGSLVEGRRVFVGTGTVTTSRVEVTGLPFTPSYVMWWETSATTNTPKVGGMLSSTSEMRYYEGSSCYGYSVYTSRMAADARITDITTQPMTFKGFAATVNNKSTGFNFKYVAIE